jgi:hypothetical protein
VNDMAKWMILILNEGQYQGQPIISKKALLELRQLPSNARALVETPSAFYGLGMNVSTDKTGRVRLSHSGGFTLGAATRYVLLPSERLGIVVLTNGMPLGVPEAIAQQFYDIVEYGSVQEDSFPKLSDYFTQLLAEHGELVGRQPPAQPVPALPDNAYLGTYANEYYGPVTVQRIGQELKLIIGPDNWTFSLRHWDGNTFALATQGENSSGLSAVKFIPANADEPGSIQIEFLDANGLGTFKKIPAPISGLDLRGKSSSS